MTSTKDTRPATFAEYVDRTGGNVAWSRASGRSSQRISQMKRDNGGVGIRPLCEMAKSATGIDYREEWIFQSVELAPVVTVWPWSPEANGGEAAA